MRTALFTLLVACGLTAAWTSGAAQTYSIALKANSYRFVAAKDGYEEIEMADFAPMGIPGKPALPTRTFLIALPPGADVQSVTVQGAPREIEGVHRIRPAPMQLAREGLADDAERAIEEYRDDLAAAYASDEPFPVSVVVHQGMGNLRKWRFAYVNFSPFQYRPKSGRLSLCAQVEIRLRYSLPVKGSSDWEQAQKTLLDCAADSEAEKLFVNFAEARSWYVPPRSPLTPGGLPGKGSGRDAVGYCVIVPNPDYCSSVAEFAAWKAFTLQPDSVIVVSVDSIEARYPGWDRVEKIRNFLIDAWQNLGLRYVLLVGSVGDVPMRECWPDPTNHVPAPDNPVPTDGYYSDLTGNWDADGDGYCGEKGEDSVDFAPEIAVGRIPESDTAAVKQILAKIASAEASSAPWKKHALMLGAVTFTYNSGYPFTDDAQVMEAIKDSLLVPQGWTCWRLYEQDGFQPSPLLCDDSLREDETVAYWSTTPCGFVNWSSHGTSASALRTINIGSTDSTPPIITNDDAQCLGNEYPSIVFSSACRTAKPDTPSLGRALLVCGAAAFVGATRAVYGLVGDLYWNSGGCTSYNCYFALHMMRFDQMLGDAVAYSKLYHRQRHYSVWCEQHNLFAFNLYGDPAYIWQGYPGVQEQAAVQPSYPSLRLFPNPARGPILVRYSLPLHSRVALRVFDRTGRVVKTLRAGTEQAGSYSLRWDRRTEHGLDVAAGVYFCRLTAGQATRTEKLVLSR